MTIKCGASLHCPHCGEYITTPCINDAVFITTAEKNSSGQEREDKLYMTWCNECWSREGCRDWKENDVQLWKAV